MQRLQGVGAKPPITKPTVLRKPKELGFVSLELRKFSEALEVAEM
ncbi:MAG: hypothetical protein ACIAQF_06555 [Phycisphaerales bacterium JB065]